MNHPAELAKAWDPFGTAIREALEKLAVAPMPAEAEFLWFVLMPQDLCGIPVLVWPTERNQQQHDGWPHEMELLSSIPATMKLPDGLASGWEGVDLLRDACADYLRNQWCSLHPVPARPAYFSINDDGWYFSLRDGRKISAWDIAAEIAEQTGNPDPPTD